MVGFNSVGMLRLLAGGFGLVLWLIVDATVCGLFGLC